MSMRQFSGMGSRGIPSPMINDYTKNKYQVSNYKIANLLLFYRKAALCSLLMQTNLNRRLSLLDLKLSMKLRSYRTSLKLNKLLLVDKI